MSWDARRRTGAALLVLAAALCAILVAGRSPASPVVGVVLLHQGGGDLVVDQRRGLVLASDAVDSPTSGTNGQPVLRVLDAGSGRLLRTLPLVYRPDSDSLTVDGQTGAALSFAVVDRTHPAGVAMVDTTTGRVIYAARLPEPSAPPSDTFMYGGYSYNVPVGPDGLAINDRAGRLFAATRSTNAANGAAAAASDNDLSMLDLATGALLHITHLPGVPGDVAIDPATQRAFIAGGTTGGLWLVDSTTGALRRTLASRGIYHVVVDQAARRVLAVGAHSLQVRDARDGRLLTTIPGSFDAPVVVSGGRALVPSAGTATSRNGTLHLLDTRRGRVLWSATLDDAPSLLAVDAPHGHVFAASCGPGGMSCTITVLSTVDGHTQRTIDVPAPIEAMAADGRTGRLFIETQGDPFPPPASPWAALRSHVPFSLPFLAGIRQAAPPTSAPQGAIIVLNLDR